MGLLVFAALVNTNACYNVNPEDSALPFKYGKPMPAIRDTVEPLEHLCIDATHYDCDGMCECDGLECPPVK